MSTTRHDRRRQVRRQAHAPPIGITTLRLAGEFGHKSTATLIEATRAAYATGATAPIVDMADMSKLSMAGLFTLHDATRLVAGVPLLTPDDGWPALRAMNASAFAVNRSYLHLANVPPAIVPFLSANGVVVRG